MTYEKNLYPLTSLLFLFFGMAMTLNAQIDPEYAPPMSDPFGLVFQIDPGQRVWVRLVDIDGDDTLEAFVFKAVAGPTSCCGEIEYYENDGSNAAPEYVPADFSSFGIIENSVIWPRNFMDIDGDGDFDLSYFELTQDPPLRILKNNGTATSPDFADAFEENPYGITLPASDLAPTNLLDGVTPAFADLDMDCDLDLMYNGAINGQTDDAYFFAENIGTYSDPSYAPPVRNDYEITFPGDNYHQSIFVDLDCDGDLDLYVAIVTSSGVNMWYYENTPDMEGSAQFSTAQLWYPLNAEDFRFVPTGGTFWDHGGDGDLDLICGGGEGIFFWENISSGNCGYSSPMAKFTFTQNGQYFTFTNESTGSPSDWLWDFGDGETSTEQNPTHTYDDFGDFKVCLEVSNEFACHGICQEFSIISGIQENDREVFISLAPNPVQEMLQLTLRSEVMLGNADLEIFDPMGQQVFAANLGTIGNERSETFDVSHLPPGVYLLKIDLGEKTLVRKFIKTAP